MANNTKGKTRTKFKMKTVGPIPMQFSKSESEQFALERQKLKNQDKAQARATKAAIKKAKYERDVKTRGAKTARQVGYAAVNQTGRTMRDDENWLSKSKAIASTIDPSTVTDEQGGVGAEKSTAEKIGSAAENVGGSYGLW